MKYLTGERELNAPPPIDGHRTWSQVRNHALSLAAEALDQLSRIAKGEVEASASQLGVMVNASKGILDVAKHDGKEENPFRHRDGSPMSSEEMDEVAAYAAEIVQRRNQNPQWATAPGVYDAPQ